MQDLLSKTDAASLQQKDETQLRAILQNQFGVTRGISRLDKDALINLIIENQGNAVPPSFIHLDDNKLEVKVTKESDGKSTTISVDGHISIMDTADLQKMVYVEFSDEPTKVVDNKPFPFAFIDDVDTAYNALKTKIAARFGFLSAAECIGTSLEDKVIEVTTGEFARIYGYPSFVDAKNKFTSDAILKTAAATAKGQDAPVLKNPANPKNVNKSEAVRKIIANFISEDKAFTSGDVMKKLKEETGMEIHRSFVSTLITKVRKGENAPKKEKPAKKTEKTAVPATAPVDQAQSAAEQPVTQEQTPEPVVQQEADQTQPTQFEQAISSTVQEEQDPQTTTDESEAVATEESAVE